MDQDSLKICPYCKKKDITSFHTCRFCGTRYDTIAYKDVRKPDLRRHIFLLLFAALAIYGIYYGYQRLYFPGTEAENSDLPLNIPALLLPPVQIMLSPPQVIKLKDYTITKVASYVITARVLCTADCPLAPEYSFYDLSPIDLGLGWNCMADKRVIRQMLIFNGARVLNVIPPQKVYTYYPEKQQIDPQQVYPNVGHTHVIPANDQIRKIILSLHRDQVVTLTGFLVNVTGPRMTPWDTSLSRYDMLCEIMYVENVKIY